FDGLHAFDFGTGTSPVMDGFTPITPATQYSRGRGYGLKDAKIWRAFDALQPEPLYQDFICIEAGGLAVDVPNGTYRVFVNIDSPSGFWGEYQTYRTHSPRWPCRRGSACRRCRRSWATTASRRRPSTLTSLTFTSRTSSSGNGENGPSAGCPANWTAEDSIYWCRGFFLRTLGSTWSGISPSRRPPTLVSGDQSVGRH